MIRFTLKERRCLGRALGLELKLDVVDLTELIDGSIVKLGTQTKLMPWVEARGWKLTTSPRQELQWLHPAGRIRMSILDAARDEVHRLLRDHLLSVGYESGGYVKDSEDIPYFYDSFPFSLPGTYRIDADGCVIRFPGKPWPVSLEKAAKLEGILPGRSKLQSPPRPLKPLIDIDPDPAKFDVRTGRRISP